MYTDGEESFARVVTGEGRELSARAVVVATGRTPYIPAPFDLAIGHRVCHSSGYLGILRSLKSAPRRAAVIGGSQSAVEVTLDLVRRFPEAEVTLFVRAPSLALKDTSPFSEEGYFPGFVDYYHRASRRSKLAIDIYMRRTNYGCADRDVLDRLYLLMYEQSLDGKQRVCKAESPMSWPRRDPGWDPTRIRGAPRRDLGGI